jgi:formylglycine-generating enzyme required for sulfatase activity
MEPFLSADVVHRTGYRLPIEAEWEFACRAGSETPWFFGTDERHLADYSWCSVNSSELSAPVGTMRPNSLGLFDVHGNIEEWCHDLSGLAITNEIVSKLAMGADVRWGERILKSGHYRAMKKSLRSAKRQSYPPTSNFSYLGFRIARTMPAAEEQ